MTINYKYKSLSEFKKAHPSEYQYLTYKGLLEQLCIDMGWAFANKLPFGYWTKERCLEEALKYDSRSEWQKKSSSSYNASKQNGWFDECVAHMVVFFISVDSWLKETCIEEARKYETKTKWLKTNNSSYKAAKKNGWFDECTAHMIQTQKPAGYWTKEKCLEEALMFNIKEEWKKNGRHSYAAALRNGWYGECTAHMKEVLKPAGYWTLERCHEEALKFNIKERWKKAHSPSYQAARLHGWIDECCSHMIQVCKPNGYWTKERCLEEAKKHTTISDWNKNETTSIQVARKNGWMEECTPHMIFTNKPSGYWKIKENVLEEALKYNFISEWAQKSSASYISSRRNGWYDECIAHMVKLRENRKPDGYWKTKENVLNEANKYNTKTDWFKNSAGAYQSAKKKMIGLKNVQLI